jgi:hypothetical protein
MAAFTADEKRELLELARSTNTRLALLEQEQKRQGECLDEHDKFINGNGKTGAKEQLAKLWGRINMVFAIGSGLWGLTVTIVSIILASKMR